MLDRCARGGCVERPAVLTDSQRGRPTGASPISAISTHCWPARAAAAAIVCRRRSLLLQDVSTLPVCPEPHRLGKFRRSGPAFSAPPGNSPRHHPTLLDRSTPAHSRCGPVALIVVATTRSPDLSCASCLRPPAAVRACHWADHLQSGAWARQTQASMQRLSAIHGSSTAPTWKAGCASATLRRRQHCRA